MNVNTIIAKATAASRQATTMVRIAKTAIDHKKPAVPVMGTKKQAEKLSTNPARQKHYQMQFDTNAPALVKRRTPRHKRAASSSDPRFLMEQHHAADRYENRPDETQESISELLFSEMQIDNGTGGEGLGDMHHMHYIYPGKSGNPDFGKIFKPEQKVA